MINLEGKRSFIVTVDRIEGDYAVCLMPDSSTVDFKMTGSVIIKEGDRLEMRFDENKNLEFLRYMPKVKRHKKLPARYVRFN